MGASLEQIQYGSKLKPLANKPNLYLTTKLPMGQPMFEGYLLLISPQYGLCQITALTPTIKVVSAGNQLRQLVDTVAGPLDRYGRATRTAELAATSNLYAPQDWMIGLYQGDRTYKIGWTKGLPDNLAAVTVEARADSTTTGYVAAVYDFKNLQNCEREGK